MSTVVRSGSVAIWVLGWLYLVIGWADAGVAATITVGQGVACDHAELLDAIDEAPSGSLILAEGGRTFVGSAVDVDSAFRVTAKSLSLVGGAAASCDGPANGLPTTLTIGRAGQRVLEVAGFGVDLFLDLVDVRLEGGESTDSGGGLRVTNWTSVGLFSSVVANNQSGLGGGIWIGSGSQLLLFDSVIESNSGTSDGGGLFCFGALVRLAGARFFSNQSAGKGGGAHFFDCVVEDVAIGTQDHVWEANTALLGGGFSVDGTTQVELQSSAGRELILHGNHAIWNGGAVSARGTSEVLLVGATASSNVAGIRGGAFFAEGQAIVRIIGDAGGASRTCHRAPCTSWTDNVAGEGGVGYAKGDGVLLFDQGVASGNEAEEGVFAVATDNGLVLVANSVISDSRSLLPSASLFSIEGGLASFVHLTIAGNPDVATVFRAADGAGLGVISSVVWMPGATVFEEAGVPDLADFECNVMHELDSLPAGAIGTLVQDPLFADVEHYRLSRESPAVDLCGANLFDRDMDGQQRIAPFDAGADELAEIFSDGFETGDSSAWQ